MKAFKIISLKLSFLAFSNAFINSSYFFFNVQQSKSKISMVSFSNLVEEKVISKFGKKETERVLDSWKRMDKGESFEKQWEGKGLQKSSSYIDGLFSEPWHDPSNKKLYPWVEKLVSESENIAKELKQVLKVMEKMEMGDNVWSVAAREEALAYGPDWRTLVLQDREWDPINSELFPVTTAAIKNSGIPSCEAFFAKQAPHTGIKPHTDDTNFILTAHLGLDIPEGECRMKVGEETREWRNNQVLIFDTSFVHSTANDSDRTRTVLLLRFFHPEVTD